HDLAGKDDLALDARIAAVRALGSSEPARPLLVDLAGAGPRALRRAVIDGLVGVPVGALVPAAQAQQAAAAAGDLWRAVTRRARRNADERAAALAAMIAALPGATDYERRYRLVDGLAAIGDAAALAQLAALLRGLPAGAEASALEQIAARAIAERPRPEALALIVGFARDPDPGVRLAALAALATSEGGAAGPWHPAEGPEAIDRVIANALAGDRWPEVRRRAAQVMGNRCDRAGPARALVDAAARDPDLDVRGDALAGLVQCKAPGTADLLARTWDDAHQPLALRQRAVDLAVGLEDRALAAKLVGRFQSWRGAALSSQDALALAQNAAYAIGRLAPPGAADALGDALDDAAFPELVAAAAGGLGLLGPACPASAAGKLRVLAHAEDQQVSSAAARAAALCGK
ncbi:MAG TPA: hypothetical protein VLX92_12860, partial [Kofleriaceae bacterium]|nr:hypothetical protein [Kofleriaceae bacterium]